MIDGATDPRTLNLYTQIAAVLKLFFHGCKILMPLDEILSADFFFKFSHQSL